MRPNGLVVAAAVYCVAGIVGAIVSPYISYYHGPVHLGELVAQTAVGAVFMTVGIVAWIRRSENTIGPLMVAVGATFFLYEFGWIYSSVPLTFGRFTRDLFLVLIAHLAIAFPTGRLESRADRIVVRATYAWWVVSTTLSMLFEDPLRQGWHIDWNLLHVAAPSRVVDVIIGVGTGINVIAVVAVLFSHRGRGSTPSRRALMPALVGSFPTASWVLVRIFDDVGVLPARGTRILYGYGWIAMTALPIGFLVSLFRARLAHSSIGDLLADLRRPMPPGGLRDALARALRDPTLELAYRLPDENRFVDAAGRPFERDGEPDRTRTTIERDGEVVAVLVHDAALDDDPALVNGVAAAAGLAIDNERLHAQVRAQLEEVRASRARIVVASDAARRRVERDLHDGAQQRLLKLSMTLAEAKDRAGDTSDLIEQAEAELRDARTELRTLAHGIHPTVLTNEGLAAAIESLAERSTVPVVIDELPRERLDPGVEATAYFIVSEALANATKHSGATRVRIALVRKPGMLVLDVGDDGVGGADASGGSGLNGLADRVAAHDGTLVIESAPGSGTRIKAELPCA